jgi:PAS domain S-box-containing protein
MAETENERLRRHVEALEAEIAQLRAAHERDRAIFESAVDFAIIATGRDGHVTDWNTGATRILGWTAAEMQGETADRIFMSEDQVKGRPRIEMRHALETGQANDERWHLRKDGSRFWASGEMMPLRGKDDAHLGFLKIMRDRTDHLRAEAALREAQNLNALILNSSRDCIVVLDLAGHTLFVSAGGIESMEISDVQAILGLSWLRIWQGADHAAARHAVTEACAGGTGRFQGYCPTHKGTPKWWDVVISPLRNKDGKPEQLVSVGRDITASVDARERLNLSEESLRLATDAAEIGTWDLDLRTSILTWSDRTKAMFGISKHVPCSMDDFYAGLHPDDREATSQAFAASLDPARRVTYDVEYRTIGKEDGIIRWIAAKGRGVFDADGRCVRAIGTAIDITARKAADQRLLDSEAALRALNADLERQVIERSHERGLTWQVSPDLLSVMNAKGFFESTNPAWQITLGWSKKDLGGTPYVDFVHPNDLQSSYAAFEKVKQGQPVLRFENRYRHRNGAYHWLSWVAVPEGDKIYCSARDITAEKDQAAALVARTAERNRVWQNSRDLLVVLGADGIIRAVNPAWSAILGHAPAEVIGYSFLDFVWPEDARLTQGGLDKAMAETNLSNFENRYRHKDGTPRWISWYTSVEDDLVYAYGRDITAQKQQAMELMERTRERDLLWRNSQDLLVVIDTKGLFRAVSPAVIKILGRTPEEMLGHAVFDFIHPDDLPSTDGALVHATQKELPSYENRYLHKDGTYRWLSWVAAPEGELIYATARHVTAEKQAEAELAAAQEQLRQSQKMEAVGQLTGGIAHDFNNLLTGITGSLELLQTRVAQGRIKDLDRYIAAASGAASRAAALTHRLLAFSRRQTLDPKPTNINRLAAGMEELIQRTVGPAIVMEMVLAAGLWQTLCDPNQLENALLNLAINARDAMPDGGKLTVETCNRWLDEWSARERDLPPGQYVSLCVSDNGTGMTAEVMARAFDPFFTTKPLGMGTGLGLSMIYGFARQSGGQVRIYSELNQGTMVCIYLPRHHGTAENAGAGLELAEAPRAEQGETVLIVDDEPTVRMLVTEVLEDLGYTAIEAADGASGLRVLQSNVRVDLLITDVGLPGGMNGRQLADAARQSRPDLRVLFITGYAENAVIGHGHLDPGMHVLTKPFPMETLASRIKDLIAAPARP